MQALKDYGYVENMGMGVRNKIIRGMKVFNDSEVLIEADEYQVKFVLLLNPLTSMNRVKFQ